MWAPRIGWPRAAGMAIVSVTILFVFIAALLGGLNRDSSSDRLASLLLCVALFLGVVLLGLGPVRAGVVVIGLALAAWIFWDLIGAPDAIGRAWPWWVALAGAAVLGWNAEGSA